MSVPAEAVVVVEHPEPGVRLLRLHRPAKRNAIDQAVRDALGAALAEADADPEVHAVVLTGTDPAFCGGADLAEVGDAALVEARKHALVNPGSVVRDTRTPLIGAINGACVTGGLEVALGCDFLIASDRATFADTHVALGLVPAWGGTALLAEAVGTRRARELSLTGRVVDAAEALELGLVQRVVPHAALLDSALEAARTVARAKPDVVEAVLRIYGGGADPERTRRIALEREVRHAWMAA